MTGKSEEFKDSIIDTTKPNAGRIYDYLLGGNHNFKIDRQAGEQLLKLVPFIKNGVRLQRWCLQDIAEELTKNRGYDIIVDFASGLPTEDHIHHVVSDNTIVIYSDIDPITVQYAREILKDIKNAYYFEADARKPEELLNRPEVLKLMKNRRDVGIIYWGVSFFFPKENTENVAKYIYNWATKDTCFVFQAQGADGNPDHPDAQKVLGIYKQMGSPLWIYSLEEYLEILKPWQPQKEDFISLLDWHGFEQQNMAEEDKTTLTATGSGYGIYLTKK